MRTAKILGRSNSCKEYANLIKESATALFSAKRNNVIQDCHKQKIPAAGKALLRKKREVRPVYQERSALIANLP
jgi:hypothetical protein